MVDPSPFSKYTPEQQDAIKRQMEHTFWQAGFLRYKDHPGQAVIDARIRETKARTFFLLCSRRFGKTFKLVSLGFEECITKPNSRVVFLAAHGTDAREIAIGTISRLIEDCPAPLKPVWHSQEKEYRFSNGARFCIKGVNGEHAKNLRGGRADLVILDECGFMDDLKYVFNDVCVPMTAAAMGLPQGRILFATTPPRTPSHESVAIYWDHHRDGHTAMFTLRDAPHIPHEEKCYLLKQAGEDPARIPGILDGSLEPETTTAKREYFCEFVTDADSAVIPEYDQRAEKEIMIEHPRPAVFDAYVALDPGMRDNTGILFAYFDFLAGKLVIEDEAVLKRAGTPAIAKVIKEKETDLWGYQEPHLRISDVDLRLIEDLRREHGIRFTQTKKDNSIGAIAFMRQCVQNRRLVIHPRCKQLNHQMHNAIWNNRSTDFARPDDPNSIDGHYDLVAALKYLCRSVNWNRNPYPAGWFDIGGRGGPPVGTYRSPKKAKPNKPLGVDTPLARRLAKARKR